MVLNFSCKEATNQCVDDVTHLSRDSIFQPQACIMVLSSHQGLMSHDVTVTVLARDITWLSFYLFCYLDGLHYFERVG